MTTYIKTSEVKKDLLKAIKNEDNVSIVVNVYDCDEVEQTYDVEISYYIDGEYADCIASDAFGEGEEKLAIKRAKAVLKLVKSWLAGWDVEISDTVEVYTN